MIEVTVRSSMGFTVLETDLETEEQTACRPRGSDPHWTRRKAAQRICRNDPCPVGTSVSL